jgi:hypothetical protein
LHVTRFPVIQESEPNDDRKHAQTVPLNTAVAGVIDSGDVDCVAVAVRKGQRLAAEVQAIRLGGEMTDTLLAVFGPDGRPLVEVDDTPITRQDPYISFSAPADGIYTIVVRDTSFGGSPISTYALYVGEFPRPSAIYPPGGQAGKVARLRLLGLAGEPAASPVTLPSDAGPWWNYEPALDGRTAPLPVVLRARPYHCVDEADIAEKSPSSAVGLKAYDWPVAFHGAIGGRGDSDEMAINVEAGQTIQVEAFAARINSALDTILEVFDREGDLVARNDDDASHDSRIIFRASARGAYRIKIRDKGTQGGLYRVEVEEPRPSLTLFLAGPARKTQVRQVIAVPRGNRVIAFLGVRRDGFDAPVRVMPGPLPKGISMDLKDIPADTYLTPVVVEAAADAPLGASLVELKGEALTPGARVSGGFEQVVDLIPGPGDVSYQSVTVGKLAVVVTDEAPYSVSLLAPGTSLVRDGLIDLVAKVERTADFDQPVEVSLPYLPPGVEMDGPGIVPAGQTEVVLRLSARADADLAAWRLAAEARPAPPRRDRREMTLALMAQLDTAAGARRRKAPVEGMPLVASRFVPLSLTAAPISGRFTPAVAAQGKSVALVCALEAASQLPGVMEASLEGLPPRAKAQPVKVAPGTTRIEFRVAVASTTPAGKFDTLVCRLAGKSGGQAVVYRVGRGGVLRVVREGALANSNGQHPLSALEALRLKERAAGAKPSAHGKAN